MNPNVGLIIALVFAALLLIIFCASFSASLAQLKGRSRKWGIVGFLLGVIGLIIVCFLPSKRDDGVQTNPIQHLLSKMPSMSQKTIGLLAGIVFAIVITVVLYDRIPVWVQNYQYEKQITKENINTLQPKLINSGAGAISAGSESSYVLTEDGSVYCFGKQLPGSLEEGGSVIYKNAKKVLSTEKVCFILTEGGELYGMGDNSFGHIPGGAEYVEELTKIAENVVDFSISETTVGFIKTDNKLYMYGDNTYGQIGTYNVLDAVQPVAVLGSVKQVVCEATYTVALQASGDAVAFGSNADGQFGKPESFINYPVVIYNGIRKIAAGDGFILLIDNDGNVLSCGANDCGQLGLGTTENSAQFTQVMTGATDIDAAKKSAFALDKDGKLFAWGQNTVGQLGTKSTESQQLPLEVAKNVTAFSTSGLHTVILGSDGKVLSTGFNNCGQLGRGDARDSFSTLVTIKK